MKTFALLLCVVGIAAGETRSISDLTPSGIVGNWESLAARADGVPVPIVLQMSFTAPDAAHLVVSNSTDPESTPRFLGKLTSSSLIKGKIHLRFSAVPPYPIPAEGVDYGYDRVEIDGRATDAGELSSVEGTLVMHGTKEKEVTYRVFFLKSLWVHELAQYSRAAQEIIKNVQAHH
ncbi:MAG: hypothetical protein ACJ8NS_05590 [Chthoniobacterales bacterium]